MKYNCLIVDDEKAIAETTCEYFNMFDISSFYVTSYGDCLSFVSEHEVSLILLDINLGDASGFELCKHLRKTLDVPILFISARTCDDDILTALNIGGDDYITKPFSLTILLAKVKAILKRYETAKPTGALAPVCERIVLDYNYRHVVVDGSPVKLKEMEFKLLSYLVEHKNQVISKDELFDNVWQDRFIGDGTLSVHIRRLREKIELNPNDPIHIKTIWRVGYVFEVKP
ncbi:MAG: response regulator transcription factor [Cellulosilyticaceae bacterium]